MANVSYWQASWVSMEGYPMSPGDVHYWEASPLGYLEAWSVTAVPIAGGEDPHRNPQCRGRPRNRRREEAAGFCSMSRTLGLPTSTAMA